MKRFAIALATAAILGVGTNVALADPAPSDRSDKSQVQLVSRGHHHHGHHHHGWHGHYGYSPRGYGHSRYYGYPSHSYRYYQPYYYSPYYSGYYYSRPGFYLHGPRVGFSIGF